VNGTSGPLPEQPIPPPPPAPLAPNPFTGRAAFAIAQIYYYGAAVVGVGFVIGGAITALIGLRELVLPSPGHADRDAVRSMLAGLAFAVPGVVFAVWHLREARSREGRVPPGAFWGRALYFHLVSFIAAVTVLSGIAAGLVALVDAALPPPCAVPVFGEPGGGSCAGSADALRDALNSAIVVIVAGAVWWWHLREARRARPLPTGQSRALL